MMSCNGGLATEAVKKRTVAIVQARMAPRVFRKNACSSWQAPSTGIDVHRVTRAPAWRNHPCDLDELRDDPLAEFAEKYGAGVSRRWPDVLGRFVAAAEVSKRSGGACLRRQPFVDLAR